MLPRRIEVLKHDTVKVGGTVLLSSGNEVTPVRASGSTATVPSAMQGQIQQARIIESNSDYAIIEITCSCGAKSHIQCNYAGLAGA